jgi:hypothetical protein
MDRQTSERFAAASEGLRTATATAVINEFLRQLARCPTCEGSGQVEFATSMEFRVGEHGRGNALQYQFIPAGTVGDCPRCGGADGFDGWDPAHVAWRCLCEMTKQQCVESRRSEGSRAADHARCGYRITIELEGDSQ